MNTMTDMTDVYAAYSALSDKWGSRTSTLEEIEGLFVNLFAVVCACQTDDEKVNTLLRAADSEWSFRRRYFLGQPLGQPIVTNEETPEEPEPSLEGTESLEEENPLFIRIIDFFMGKSIVTAKITRWPGRVHYYAVLRGAGVDTTEKFPTAQAAEEFIATATRTLKKRGFAVKRVV